MVARQPDDSPRRQPRPPYVRRLRQRAGLRRARHLHVPQHDDGAVRSVEAVRRAELHAADQLRHHQLQPESVAGRRLRAGQHPRRQRPHARSRPALRRADADRRERTTSRRASASAGTRAAIARTAIRGGYGMYYTQIQSNLVGGLPDERPRRLHHLHRDAGTARLPDLPDRRRACRCSFDPKTLPPSQLPARNITIRAGAGGVLPSAVRAVRAELRPAAELSRQAREPAQPGGVDRRGA